MDAARTYPRLARPARAGLGELSVRAKAPVQHFRRWLGPAYASIAYATLTLTTISWLPASTGVSAASALNAMARAIG